MSAVMKKKTVTNLLAAKEPKEEIDQDSQNPSQLKYHNKQYTYQKLRTLKWYNTQFTATRFDDQISTPAQNAYEKQMMEVHRQKKEIESKYT